MTVKRFALIIAVLLIFTTLLTGCGQQENEEDDYEDVIVYFSAYQFAKSEVQERLPIPNSAIFANITEDVVVIEELEGNLVQIKSEVNYRVPNSEQINLSGFTVVIESLGEGRFELVSLEMQKAELPEEEPEQEPDEDEEV